MNLNVTRRDCLRAGLALGGALFVGWNAQAAAPNGDSTSALGLWLLVHADGRVTLRTNASEMGQGAQSAMAQIVCEELELTWGEVDVVMAPVEPEYFGLWNDYVTGGSASIRGMFDKLRVACATARQLLLTAACREWGIPIERCVLRSRQVVDSLTGSTLEVGRLASRAAALTLDRPAVPKAREQWRIIGKGVERLDTRAKINGRAQFGIDAGPKDALIALIAQAPEFGTKLKSVSLENTPKKSVRLIRLPTAVAVVADDFWTAKQSLDALRIEWIADAGLTRETDYALQLGSALDAPGEVVDADRSKHQTLRDANQAAFSSAARVIDSVYETPLLAHACMEPMNASADVRDGRATVWVPTQAQGAMRRDVAQALGLQESAVTVHTTLMGGGFGRRLNTDYGVQAALVAREVQRPVKLIWSREQDVQHDFYRQAALARFRCALDSQDEIRGVRVQLAALGACSPGGIPPYRFPNTLVTTAQVPTRIPLGAWRAVEANHNTFFMESFVDELAVALRQHPLTFRRALLATEARALRTLNAAVELSGMERGTNEVRKFGLGVCAAFGSICAQVVELSVPAPKTIKIHRINCALDCGTAVNPDSVRAQIEGGILMALSAACYEKVTIRDGRVAQSNFHDYPVLRAAQVPDIQSIILESSNEPMGGCGEPPVPPLAPALCNALFAATGVRIRRLPLIDSGWNLV